MGAILRSKHNYCASTAGRWPRFRQAASETAPFGDAPQQSEGGGGLEAEPPTDVDREQILIEQNGE
jgi:hypothetical protein